MAHGALRISGAGREPAGEADLVSRRQTTRVSRPGIAEEMGLRRPVHRAKWKDAVGGLQSAVAPARSRIRGVCAATALYSGFHWPSSGMDSGLQDRGADDLSIRLLRSAHRGGFTRERRLSRWRKDRLGFQEVEGQELPRRRGVHPAPLPQGLEDLNSVRPEIPYSTGRPSRL